MDGPWEFSQLPVYKLCVIIFFSHALQTKKDIGKNIKPYFHLAFYIYTFDNISISRYNSFLTNKKNISMDLSSLSWALNPKKSHLRKLRITLSTFFCFSLWTFRVFTRSSVVKIVTPNTVYSSSYVITIWMIRENFKIRYRNKSIVPIYHLKIPKVRRFSKTFTCKMATAHLSRSMWTTRSCVHDLTTELDHVPMLSQVCEQRYGPISD